LTYTENSGIHGEDSGHYSTFGFSKPINSCFITVVHTVLFNINKSRSSGKVDNEVSFFSDGAGPLVEKLFVNWGVLLVEVHFQVERVVKGNVVFKFVSESSDVKNVVDQFHEVALLVGAEGRVDSLELHGVVEGDVGVIEQFVSEEIAVDDDVFGEDDFVTETDDSGDTGFGAHTDFLPCEVDGDFDVTSFNDDGIISDNFSLLLGVSVVESGVGIGDDVSDGVIDSP
jgi:hypothetical protein